MPRRDRQIKSYDSILLMYVRVIQIKNQSFLYESYNNQIFEKNIFIF